MSDALIRAIRSRDLISASHVIDELQTRLSNEAITKLIIATVERLAWDEGDRCAATWLLQRSHQR